MNFARSSALLLIWILAAIVCKADPQAGRAPDRSTPPPSDVVVEFRGSGSCSAVACHGSITPRPALTVLGNEHTTWVCNDRHSRAYQTLFDERSGRIVANLAPARAQPKPASEDERCLACHTSPRSSDLLEVTRWMNQDGVGCESCHGASARWLGPHTTEGWRQLQGRDQKEAFGFVDTKSLPRRATVCAGCHVGATSAGGLPLRDVNHDLIAAGHPRLNFELSAFLDNMPPHWVEKDENADPTAGTGRAANFPARAWAIGQLATALASLELLIARVQAAQAETGPWPEFAEYGCFSCHHDLRDDTWRRARPAGPARPIPSWGSWSTPMARELAREFIADPAATEFCESIEQIGKLMDRSSPGRTLIAVRSRETALALRRSMDVLASMPMDAREVEKLLTIVNRREAWDRTSSWDEAALRYLALVPLYQARLALAPATAGETQNLRSQIDALLQKLKFPPGMDSPRGFDPNRLSKGR